MVQPERDLLYYVLKVGPPDIQEVLTIGTVLPIASPEHCTWTQKRTSINFGKKMMRMQVGIEPQPLWESLSNLVPKLHYSEGSLPTTWHQPQVA